MQVLKVFFVRVFPFFLLFLHGLVCSCRRKVLLIWGAPSPPMKNMIPFQKSSPLKMIHRMPGTDQTPAIRLHIAGGEATCYCFRLSLTGLYR